jgi:NADH-quinone oxidoreductase subunit L
LTVVAIVGAFTCLFAAVIACTQDDIKRVLAFSTLSQLGYMMLALGVATYESAAGYTASLFHLFTHAMFKALLFLGAGAVIHAVHSNNLWGMGGLAKKMPYTHLTFLIATLAIAGVPPLSGFFSKDMILASALENGHPVLFGVGLLVAGLTAFYMMRLYLLTFAGESRSEAASHAHEAPLVMLIPLLILALLSAITGLIPIDQFVWIGKEHASHHGWLVPILAVSAGAFGIAVAWFVYGGNLNRSDQVVKSLGPLYPVIENKFYIDEIYLFITRRVIFPFVSAPIAWFDRHIVDGAVNLTGRITQMAGTVLSHLQTGQIQTYGLWLVNGAVIVAMLLWGLSR